MVTESTRVFAAYGAVLAVVAVGLAFGFSRPVKQVPQVAIKASSDMSANRGGALAGAAASTISAMPDFDPAPYVQVATISGKALAKNYDAGRYRNSILISPVFRNVGVKTIVGLHGRLSLVDGFGKEVYGFNFRVDEKIPPGKDSGRGGYSFEENEFDSDDPYHKMLPLIEGGTAKYAAKIAKVAFEDGTVLPKN